MYSKPDPEAERKGSCLPRTENCDLISRSRHLIPNIRILSATASLFCMQALTSSEAFCSPTAVLVLSILQASRGDRRGVDGGLTRAFHEPCDDGNASPSP